MDNRRVAKVYRDRSQRVRKLPTGNVGGLFSRVKRYLSTSALPARIASLRSTSNGPETESKQDAGPKLPEPPSSANNSLVAHGSEDSNRILSSFFQEKGSQPLSQVEYEGVMSLLDRLKASVTLPLPEPTPERKKSEFSAANIPANGNSTFANYSQKVLRNTSGYDASGANNTSLMASEYKPVYHTFNDVSRSNTSFKRVYPFSGVPSPYRTRIKVPNLAARKARRIASEAPSMASLEAAADASMESRSFKPKSKAANSLLSILDGNDSAPDSAKQESDNTNGRKPLHNPYAKAKRFTPLQKGDIAETQTPPVKADQIAKTVAYSKTEDLKPEERIEEKTEKKTEEKTEKKAEKVDSLFGTGPLKSQAPVAQAENSAFEPKAKGPEKSTSDSQPSFSFGAVKNSQPSEKSSAAFKPLFAGVPDSNTKTTTDSDADDNKTAQSEFVKASEKADLPKFSFGAKSNTTAETGKTDPAQSLFGNSKDSESKPAFSFGSNNTASATGGFSFGAKPSVEAATESAGGVKDTKTPLFSFGAQKTNGNSLFGSNATNNASASQPESSNNAPKPAFNLGAKLVAEQEAAESKDESSGQDEKIVEIVDIDSDEGKVESSSSKTSGFNVESNQTKNTPLFSTKQSEQAPSSLFSFGSKPAAEKPAFSFAEKSSSQTATPAFNFSKSSGNSSDKPQPAFSFGSKPAAAKEETTPKFGFGLKSPSDQQTSSGNSASSTQKPLFKFGGQNSTNEPAAEKPASGSSAESNAKKPAFGDASSTPAFNFGSKIATESPSSGSAFNAFENKSGAENGGSKPVSKLDSNVKPAFSFGNKSSEDNSASTQPLFKFGTQPQSTSSFTGFNQLPSSGSDLNGQSTQSSGKIADSGKPESKSTANLSNSSQPNFSFGKSDGAAKNPFTFGAKSAQDSGSKPVSNSTESPAQTKPAFGFGATPAGSVPASNKTTFSFGKQPVSAAPAENAFAFGSGSKPAESHSTDKKPAFDFAAKPAASLSAKQKEESSSNNDTESKLSAPKPAFSFGSKPTENKPAEAKSQFGFGSIPTENKSTEAKSAFGFGGKATENKSVEAKQTFNFGTKPAESKHAETEQAFGFGDQSSKNEPAEAKPAFSFGANPVTENTSAFKFGGKLSEKKPEENISVFGSGSKATDNASAKSTSPFTFGAKPANSASDETDAAPKHTTDSTETNGPKNKPVFNFGAKPTNSGPSFGFGTQSSKDKPSFGFGSQSKTEDTEKQEAVSTAKPKPAFSFGSQPSASNVKNTTEAKPAFSFGTKPFDQKTSAPLAGAGAETNTSKPLFSFGAKPSDAGTKFSFGDKSEAPKSAFSFGSAASANINASKKENGQNNASTEEEFEFGEVPLQTAELDQDKVREYEKLFPF